MTEVANPGRNIQDIKGTNVDATSEPAILYRVGARRALRG